MIKMELSSFKIIIKFLFRHAIKLSQPTFAKAPERLYTIYVSVTTATFAGNAPGADLDSSTSMVPSNGLLCLQQRAILVLNLSKIFVIERRETLLSSAVSVAVKSIAKHLIKCQNWASEICRHL